MSNDDANTTAAPTRRDTLKYGGAVVAGGALAGCLSRSDSGSTDGETPSESTYEACIEPAGCLTFEEVPETYAVYNGGWADMAIALGQEDGLLTASLPVPSFFYEPFGIDPSPSSSKAFWSDGSWDKESFYELDPDVFLIDPKYLHETGWDDSWDEDDTQDIIEDVAPFFGNNCRRRREFHDYKLYSLYGAFDKLADLFQERERYEAFVELHDEVQEKVQSGLPAEGDRTKIGLINGGSEPEKGKFYPLNTQDEGYEMKPYRDLEVESAFPQEMEDAGTIDYEELLDVDPEIIVVHWGIGTTGEEGQGAGNSGGSGFAADIFREQYIEPMEEDSVGSQLTAVQEGRVYPGAFGEQGPIANLLQTEMKAQQLYPEQFGEFDPEAFPEVPEENQLFDRQRVADIINGDV